MNRSPSLSGLTPYATALAALLAPLKALPPVPVPLPDATGLIAAGTETGHDALPPQPLARIDGWACTALDLVGATVMAPVMLSTPPAWVECGQPLPAGCDAVVPPDLMEQRGPLALFLGEALPGEGVVLRGEWLAAGAPILRAGQRIGPTDILLAGMAGLTALACRVATVRLIDTGASGLSSRLVANWLGRMGCRVGMVPVASLDRVAIRDALLAGGGDLVLMIGGTGRGKADHTAEAMSDAGALIAHGIGLSSAPTATFGYLGHCPVIALPGLPDAAMAGAMALLHPVLSRLTAREAAPPLALPLLRKVTSTVGQAELLLLSRSGDGWLPLATGFATPDQFRRADGWRIIAAEDEGWPAGAVLDAAAPEGWT